MQENIIKGKWRELRGEIRRMWGKLTDDELEETKGNLGSVAGLIQQKYGVAQDEARRKLDEIATRFSEKTDYDEDDAESQTMGSEYRDDRTRNAS